MKSKIAQDGFGNSRRFFPIEKRMKADSESSKPVSTAYILSH
jgi:hypothetical protein